MGKEFDNFTPEQQTAYIRDKVQQVTGLKRHVFSGPINYNWHDQCGTPPTEMVTFGELSIVDQIQFSQAALEKLKHELIDMGEGDIVRVLYEGEPRND